MSKTREKFNERRKAVRAARKEAAYLAAHTFWCRGPRRKHGVMGTCQFEVRFRVAAPMAKATCSRCRQAHVFYEGPINGVYKQTWLTVEEHGELYIPDESMTTLESVYREVDAEKNVKGKEGYMQQVQETIVIADHAPWCGSPDVPIIGLRAKMGGPGRIRWRDRKGVIRHNCVSSEAGRKHGIISAQVRANTGKELHGK